LGRCSKTVMRRGGCNSLFGRPESFGSGERRGNITHVTAGGVQSQSEWGKNERRDVQRHTKNSLKRDPDVKK